MGNIIAAIASIVVGGAVASVTVLGLVNSNVNSSADSPGNINDPVIAYGTTP